MLERFNFHWRNGFFYGFPKKRALFNELVLKAVDCRQIISIVGLRRTGKTTLLKQLIDFLIESRMVKRENILFFSFDEEQLKLETIFSEFEARIGKEVLQLNETIFVFLDEIQKLENWQNQVKYYYDNYKNVKFFVSGSASLFIKKHAMESLAGRIFEFTLSPLNFKEFLDFRNKLELIEKKQLLPEALKQEFLAFQKRQFVDVVNESEENIAQYTKSMIEKIVFQDIPKIFPIEYEELLLKILKIIAAKPGMLSDYGGLSQELGISRVTLSNHFFYLEEAFLIKKLYNFSNNQLSSEKKLKKFYLQSTSFFSFLCNAVPEEQLVENLVVEFTEAKFFWRTPQQYEVDIVLKNENSIMPVEVKYGESVSEKDAKNLLRFCEKFNVEKALMVTKNFSGKKEFELSNGKKAKIFFIPVQEFLLQKAGSIVE